jgi:hypothetical protein
MRGLLVYFLHYLGKGDPKTLIGGVRRALDTQK